MNFFANTGAVQLSIRAAKEADLDRLVEIHMACYPDDRTEAQRRIGFQQNAFGHFEDLCVAERNGRLVGHAFGFSLVAHFGGRPVPALGIASVGVAPEARGSDIGARLVAYLENEARACGKVISLLYAFRHGFYAKRGYADVSPMNRLVCDPRAVPLAWVERARTAPLRAAGAADVASIIKLHRFAAKRLTGCTDRPKALWTRLFARERLQVIVLGASKGHQNTGYVTFELLQDEPHAKTRLEVYDLVATNDEARRTLWGFLGMQAGQVTEMEIEVAADDPITFALTDIDGGRFGEENVEHVLGGIVAGPMIRVLDVRRALAARGYVRNGDVDLTVADASFRIAVRGGRASVKATRARGASLIIDARTLASIAFGGLGVANAATLGLVKGSGTMIERADAILRLPPFVTLDRF